ncbi:transcription-repair coupling factor [Lacrimispora amygdalina]|uniref:Transcription-repair-coupling factor n=1 Tax=Lacrimispora amygdalina TaxID=253257 RepID=A0A3E2N5M7_9FIRM|nr:transcription-repair coupling factor [Clostridium indicum]RFZ76295.1 transcription-repair coupling factor [Clostridium indicum]
MNDLFEKPLKELKDFEGLCSDLAKKAGPVMASGCMDSQKVHLMYEAAKQEGLKLVVTYDDTRAREIYEDLRFFDSNAWLYPARDLLFFNADIHGNLLTKQRMAVFRHLMEQSSGWVVTTFDGLMDHLMPLADLKKQALFVESGQIIDVELWKKRLTQLGYERMGQVDGMGQFSIRGGIIDIFPLTEELPVRIELWDNEVDSIRTFDLESQRSIEQLDEICIYPATEMVLTSQQINEGMEELQKELKKYEKDLRAQSKIEEAARIRSIVSELIEGLKEGWKQHGLDGYIHYFCKGSVSFLDYFSPENTVFFLDEPERLKEKGETVEMEFRESMIHRLENGYLLPGQTNLLYPAKEMLARIQMKRGVYLTGLEQKLSGFVVKNRYSFQVKNVNSYQNSFELLIKDLTRWKREGYRVILLSASRTRASRLAGDLREYDLRAYYPDDKDGEREVKPGEILVTYGSIHRGFEYPMIKFLVITEGDMFGMEKKKRKRKKTVYEGTRIQNFSDLSVGDYVVHEDHGLGIYRGIEKIEQDGVIKDYLKVEYAENGNLYLPATRLDGIQKYAGAEAKKPKLNRLGGDQWNKTKTRVKGAVKEIAKDLVMLYAARQQTHGFRYGEDTVWQKEFEEMFPYEETEDQWDAIESTKADMESGRIMDRLICGDVGYGKTEIALRAAFKAVQEGKQVVYLVPTTILAQQHYNTFAQRMKDFPVRVDLMSRFKTSAQVKKTVEDLRKGMVDIVVGTHRVLSKDVQFKDLGLLIIDEEQRFGVAHKEKIKQLKENIDVLTLTATPIPRTLHMSLVGIRDMSVLEEPPVDRMPIQTYVMEHNDEMVREAIHRELSRGGQVYYVYNRVNNIDEVANHIAKLVPEAVVTFAHGQMHEHELERIMFDFVNGEIDVLVCTTIIETGLDISNANTMIIQDADRMGLSQLYQLRGRVGRSSRTAYAFLMYKRDKMLKEEAEKRLQAIREFTELGSGIKIAMRDLEIRGAGNVLGAEQHGHMEAVGYDLYCKLLNQAVLELKGERKEEDTYETVVDCDIDAYIPTSYIKNEYQKLDIYKRISSIETEDEHMDMQDELMDRFGEMPKPVENLLKVAALKALAHSAYVTEVNINRQEIRLTMYRNAKLKVEGIPKIIEEYRGDLKFHMGEEPKFAYLDRKKNATTDVMISQAEVILKQIVKLSEK